MTNNAKVNSEQIMSKSQKEEEITGDLVKKIMLDYNEVNQACLESVRKYAERCMLAETLYNGYKNYMKIVGEKKIVANKHYAVSQATTQNIERLLRYRDEYIG
jgi:hypothetical protein